MEDLHIPEWIRPTQEMAEFVPSQEDQYIGSGDNISRLIYANVEFTSFETDKLQEFKDFSSHNFDDIGDGEILRALYSQKFNYKKTSKHIELLKTWRATNCSEGYLSFYPKVKHFLSEGGVYVHGRDKKYCPILIINLSKMDLTAHSGEDYCDLICFFLEIMLSFMFIPGKIENWIVLIDLAHKSLTKIPIGQLKKILGILNSNYSCRMVRTFIVNAPSSLKFIWKIVSGFLDKETVEKIKIYNDGQFYEMLQYVNPDQLELKYGGDAENIVRFWPPAMPGCEIMFEESRNVNMSVVGSQYSSNERKPSYSQISTHKSSFYRNSRNFKLPPSAHYSEMIPIRFIRK